METSFTPLMSLAGGALIGLAAVMLMFFQGRIMGATGVLTGFIFPEDKSDFSWRAAIILGMVSAPLAYLLVTGGFPTIDVPVSTPMLVIGGILVGIGVTYGGGCTSGHGVCGNARFSLRSTLATATFMVFAVLTVFIVRHGFGG